MKRLFPYSVLVGETVLEVTDVAVDGVLLSVGRVAENGRVALHRVERDSWEEARIGVRVRVPESESSQGVWTDIAVSAALRDRVTRVRSCVPLRATGAGTWSGTVPVFRDLHHDQVELSAHVTATVDGVAGRMIGSTERVWTIGLRSPSSPSAAEERIATVWKDFSDHPVLDRYRKDPWLIECTGERPTILLNRGFEGLEHAYRAGDPTLRKALSSQIAADAWVAIGNAAIQAIEVDQEYPSLPEGWPGTVLRCLVPVMFPDLSLQDALAEIASRRSSGEDGDLQTRVGHAAREQAGIARGLGGLLRLMDRQEQK